MKVGGGLNYVEGPMGAGKTLYGVRAIVDAVTHGRYAVTNVELMPDAFDRMAAHVTRFSASRRTRAQLAQRFASYYIFDTQLEDAILYDPPGKGEARALFVWDETHNDLNSRNWKERAARFATDTGTDALLEWATQLRKLGYVGFLLSQHQDNTDVVLRRICNNAIRLQNQREQTRVLGLRVTPWPLFLAYWYAANTAEKRNNANVKPLKVERYFLGWHRHLYDTMGLFHGIATGVASGRRIALPEGGWPLDLRNESAQLRPAGPAPTPGPSGGAGTAVSSVTERLPDLVNGNGPRSLAARSDPDARGPARESRPPAA